MPSYESQLAKRGTGVPRNAPALALHAALDPQPRAVDREQPAQRAVPDEAEAGAEHVPLEHREVDRALERELPLRPAREADAALVGEVDVLGDEPRALHVDDPAVDDHVDLGADLRARARSPMRSRPGSNERWPATPPSERAAAAGP